MLQQIATCVTTGPLRGKTLKLVGRADPRGEVEYNMGLGEHRADEAFVKSSSRQGLYCVRRTRNDIASSAGFVESYAMRTRREERPSMAIDASRS